MNKGFFHTIGLTGFLILLCFSNIQAQDIQFTASAKPVVAVGETFTLVFRVNGQASGFRGPSIPGFDVLSGSNGSTSSSIESINGRTSMSITYMYSYVLQANREGSFDIPAATVTVDKKTYTSNTLTIKVVKDASSGAQGGQQGATLKGSQQNLQTGPNDVYLKAFASNSNPMQGEEIVVTYKIYTKVPISQISINKLSSFNGFWSQNLIKDNDKFNQYTQMIDGQQYAVAEIRKIALFPLKSGKLVIDPMEMECVAQIKRQSRSKTGDPFFDDFFNDSFFSNSYAAVEKNLKSNPLVINVRALPNEGRPADFSGAVGNFKMTSEIDKTSVRANDPISLKFVISGQGNIQLIDKLNITFPPDFETYDPKVTSNVNTTAGGVNGSQAFEYLVIPRKPGKFTIKPVTFTYYDLTKRQYITLSSQEFKIDVAKGSSDQSTITYSGANREDIQYIGNDIRYIINTPMHLRKSGSLFFGSPLFIILLILPVVLLILLKGLWKKQEARRSNVMLMKNRKATRVAKKRLKKAEDFMKGGKQEEFYIEISLALWGYIGDKFSIPPAELSMDNVQDALVRRGVNEPTVKQFIEALNSTEFARFAPGDKNVKMEEVYHQALEIISKIERELRS
jgi:hypothetical protein